MQNIFNESSKNQESIFALFIVIFFWQQSASATQKLQKFSFTVGANYQDRLFCQALAEPGVQTNRDSVFVTPVYLGNMFQWIFSVIIYD